MTAGPIRLSRTNATRRFSTIALALVGVLLLLGISPSTASARTSGWLAAKVAEDGSVVDPYGTEPSIDWTVNTALALASSGDQPEALAKTLGYISSHVEAYIASGTSDPAGHLSWLILLAVATGGDPSAFGTTHIDLPARLATRLGVSETGLYGIVDDYTPVTNQSLAILALIGSQHSVDPAALGWLLSQQCSGPTGQQGAWQGHRMAATPGPLADCLATTSSEFNRPDVASTAYAVMALAAVRDDGIVVSGLDEAIASGLAWLHSMQAVAGVATGGFGQYVGDAADPNSTALAILALRSADIDPGTWTVGAANPVSSLDGWVISSGADAGALASPYSSGEGDLFATFQGLWGQAQRPFPFAPAQIDDPSREPVAGRAEDGVVTPVFTG